MTFIQVQKHKKIDLDINFLEKLHNMIFTLQTPANVQMYQILNKLKVTKHSRKSNAFRRFFHKNFAVKIRRNKKRRKYHTWDCLRFMQNVLTTISN